MEKRMGVANKRSTRRLWRLLNREKQGRSRFALGGLPAADLMQ